MAENMMHTPGPWEVRAFIAAAANNMSELVRLARIGQRVEQDINAVVRDGMRDAWNEICADSGHHPRDITHGRGSELWFEPSTWADWTASYVLRVLTATGPTEAHAPRATEGK